METYSVSKGTFLFAPTACEPDVPCSGAPTTLLQPLHGETASQALQRQEAYTACWTQINAVIQGVLSRQHDQISADLMVFIAASAKKLAALRLPDLRLPPRLEVPTAVLLAGVNMPDHDVLFQQLQRRVSSSSQLGAHVVSLRSKDCNTGVKATMRELLLQLMRAEHRPQDSSDDEGDTADRPLPLCSMPLLAAWYAEAGGSAPIVIFIEDFEGFVPHILCDLITSLSPHLPELPVVLVLGVATSLAAIHRTLPRHASSLLCLDALTTLPPSHTLAQLLEEVLVSPSLPFKLGPRCLHFLLHRCLASSSSLHALSQALNYALIEHFTWQPLSTLCCHGNQEWVREMSHTHCEMLRATPSFQKYVLQQAPELQVSLLEEDAALRLAVGRLLEELRLHHLSSSPLLRCLHHLTRPLPGSPLGRKLHELYLLSVEQTITEGEKFQAAWTLLGMLGRLELSSAVVNCCRVLEAALSSHPALEGVSQALRLFTDFSQALEGLAGSGGVASDLHGDHSTTAVVQESTSERKLRFQERLRQVSSRQREPSAFDSLRAKLLDSLLPVLQSNLACPSSLPLHEVFYFNTASSLRKQLAASPRSSLQAALSSPAYYLPDCSSGSEQASLTDNMPDVCIVYQLHLECGRLINLFDWLQAFIAVVQPDGLSTEQEQGVPDKKRSKEEVDPVLHARFIQAVSELQFLGFIKPTLRKTDHVQRLTWGAC